MPPPKGPVKYTKIYIPVLSHGQLTAAIRTSIEADLNRVNIGRYFPDTCDGTNIIEIETVVVT